jgi:probable aminopeptidase NPEPL1
VQEIRFAKRMDAALEGAEVVLVAAPKQALTAGWHRTALGTPWAAELDRPAEDVKPGDLGGVAQTYGNGDGSPRRLVVGALPDRVSRHNSPSRSEMVRVCVEQAKLAGRQAVVLVYVDDAAHYAAVAVAVARAFPLFSLASRPKDDDGRARRGRVTVAVALPDGTLVPPPHQVQETVDTVRLVARLVDTPPQDMSTAEFEREARKLLRGVPGVRVSAIVGDKLLAKGLGGIHGVGRAAAVPPRLLVMDYRPARKPRRTVALVGKGIVYDTGGLSLKVGGSMENMKCDMGGAGAVLGALLLLAKGRSPDRVVALACLAENSVGPTSYRPDDVLTLHSGKTVEVNNTDAEGRLVVADGVSWAAREVKADVVVDAATLTGAALVCTGEAVSCTVSNREGLERLAVECGRATGDLTFPLLFVPELLKQEFASKVADMRNSVKNRMNAQSSAAGQFIYNHIEDLDVPWLHLDIAGPAFRAGRGTGHGVVLMTEIVRRLDGAHLAS